MISDEPDEDAVKLDDAIVLGTVVGHDSPTQGSSAENATPIADWPKLWARDVGLDLDHETLTWFQANHADWREEIGHVLQAWVALKTQVVTDAMPRL